MRPIGWRAIKFFFSWAGSLPLFTLSSHEGVWTVAGAIALHLILCLTKSAAMDLVKPIIAAFDRVELLNYAFEVEFVCRLKELNKISEDATISLIKMFTDHKLYQTMMGRETNFRYSDLSSVFKDAANPILSPQNILLLKLV